MTVAPEPRPHPRVRYSYWLVDPFTGEKLATVPLRDVRYSRVASGVGELSGQVRMGTAQAQASGLLEHGLPAKAWLFAVRHLTDAAGQPVGTPTLPWGGILLHRRRYARDGVMVLRAATVGEMFRHLTIPQSVGNPLRYTDADPLHVARDLVVRGMAGEGAGVRIRVRTAAAESSPVRVTRTYPEQTHYPRILDLLDDLAGDPDGFDYSFRPQFAGDGLPEFVLELDHPRIAGEDAPLLWRYPGHVADVEYPEDGTDVETDTRTLGRDGDNRLLVGAASNTLRSRGWPRRDGYHDVPGASSLARLHSVAAEWSRLRRDPVTLPVVQLNPSHPEVDLALVREGEDARLVAEPSAVFPYGLDVTGRIVQVDVQPPQRGRPVEQVTVALDPASAQEPS